MEKRVVVISLILLLSVSTTAFLIWSYRHSPEKPSAQVDIAIYSGRGTWEQSVKALRAMFLWMNYTVEYVSADRINNIGLASFRILCIPGGDMYEYAQDISTKGKENIRNFIHDGGGYIGICGGAYFASERVIWRGNQLPMTPLGIFPGIAAGPINEIISYPNYTMTIVKIISHEHPITQSELDSASVLYYWGPAMAPNPNANVTILGNYSKGNQTAMLAFQYYQGRVFLIGTHPEIEEDSDRDGVSFGDQFDDEGSEWHLMQKAVLWALKR